MNCPPAARIRRAALARLRALAALVLVVSGIALAGENAAPGPAWSIEEDAALLEKGRISSRKKALARLGANPDPAADAILLAAFRRFEASELPPAIWLDLFEAAAKRNHPDLKAMLARREEKLAKSVDPLARYQECLEGGDGAAGREIFMKKAEAGCVRCHTVDGKGGAIGPDLTWLRNSVSRTHILESIVMPDSQIATGFQSAALTLKGGEIVAGVVSAEDPDQVTVTAVADGKKRSVPAGQVETRTALPSPMPPHFGAVLDKRAIRDLVEFLAAGD